MVDAFRPRIAFDQKIIIITAVVCQGFNRGKIARPHHEQGLYRFAEITPMY
jgi:hypothetical protein